MILTEYIDRLAIMYPNKQVIPYMNLEVGEIMESCRSSGSVVSVVSPWRRS